MKEKIIRKVCQILPVLLMAGALTACDTHIEVPDTAVRPGHVLCVDGKTMPYNEYEQSGKQAIGIVFDTHQEGKSEGYGYAVYLWDIEPAAFADSLGVEQGTSADIEAVRLVGPIEPATKRGFCGLRAVNSSAALRATAAAARDIS